MPTELAVPCGMLYVGTRLSHSLNSILRLHPVSRSRQFPRPPVAESLCGGWLGRSVTLPDTYDLSCTAPLGAWMLMSREWTEGSESTDARLRSEWMLLSGAPGYSALGGRGLRVPEGAVLGFSGVWRGEGVACCPARENGEASQAVTDAQAS